MNYEALRWCGRIAAWGEGYRSRSILFTIALLTCLDPERRRPLRALLREYLRLRSSSGVLSLTGRPPGNRRQFDLALRWNDLADYQSLTECLGTMYELPKTAVRYVLDGGANIGFFALSALRLRDLRELVLIEPSPNNMPLLRRNVLGLPGCTLHPVVLAAERGMRAFDLATSNTGHIVDAASAPASTKLVEIEARRITEMIPAHWDARHTWVKLDIEGAEYEVIPDMLRAGYLPVHLSAEIHDYLRMNGAGLVQALEQHGYDVTVEGYGHEGNVCRQISATLRARN